MQATIPRARLCLLMTTGMAVILTSGCAAVHPGYQTGDGYDVTSTGKVAPAMADSRSRGAHPQRPGKPHTYYPPNKLKALRTRLHDLEKQVAANARQIGAQSKAFSRMRKALVGDSDIDVAPAMRDTREHQPRDGARDSEFHRRTLHKPAPLRRHHANEEASGADKAASAQHLMPSRKSKTPARLDSQPSEATIDERARQLQRMSRQMQQRGEYRPNAASQKRPDMMRVPGLRSVAPSARGDTQPRASQHGAQYVAYLDFAKQASLEKVKTFLKVRGINDLKETKTDDGAHRIRLGQFGSKSAAERRKAQIKQKTGLTPKVAKSA